MNVTSIVFGKDDRTRKIANTLTSVWKQVHYTQIDISDLCPDYTQYTFDSSEVCYIIVPIDFENDLNTIKKNISEMNARNTPSVIVSISSKPLKTKQFNFITDSITKAGFLPIAQITVLSEHKAFNRKTGKYNASAFQSLQEIALQLKDDLSDLMHIKSTKEFLVRM